MKNKKWIRSVTDGTKVVKSRKRGNQAITRRGDKTRIGDLVFEAKKEGRN
jgi:hypothetical protein